jgi:hypothetical protein
MMAEQRKNPGTQMGIGPRRVIEKPTDVATLAQAGIDPG